MAHRWYEIHNDGTVDVDGVGIVGKVVKVSERPLRWGGYVGHTLVGISKTLNGAGVMILNHRGLKEGKLKRQQRGGGGTPQQSPPRRRRR